MKEMNGYVALGKEGLLQTAAATGKWEEWGKEVPAKERFWTIIIRWGFDPPCPEEKILVWKCQ